MANRANSMFSDRRDNRRGRRKNDLPTPAGLDRRVDSRRTGQFHSGDWWLKVDYADEFVSEKAFAEELKQIKAGKKPLSRRQKPPRTETQE